MRSPESHLPFYQNKSNQRPLTRSNVKSNLFDLFRFGEPINTNKYHHIILDCMLIYTHLTKNSRPL